MSRKIRLWKGPRTKTARLRGEWRASDPDLIVDLHRRSYDSEGAAFGGQFPDYVAQTGAEANLGGSDCASRVWFAECANETLGCAAMIVRGGRGQLRRVVLAPEGRGHGLDTALFDAAMHHTAAKGHPVALCRKSVAPRQSFHLTAL